MIGPMRTAHEARNRVEPTDHLCINISTSYYPKKKGRQIRNVEAMHVHALGHCWGAGCEEKKESGAFFLVQKSRKGDIIRSATGQERCGARGTGKN